MQRRAVYPFRNPRPPKIAMVVVDMQEACRNELAYSCGSVQEGIARTASVIGAVRRMGHPVVLVMGESTPEPLREVDEAAGPDAVRFTKGLRSAFTVPAFRRFLEQSLSDALVIAGWVKGICVRDTMLDAIWNGYTVISSDEILFHRAGVPPIEALMPHERLFFFPRVDYHGSVPGLLRSIGMEGG